VEKISDVVDDVTWLYDVILVTSLSQYITSQTDRQQTDRQTQQCTNSATVSTVG